MIAHKKLVTCNVRQVVPTAVPEKPERTPLTDRFQAFTCLGPRGTVASQEKPVTAINRAVAIKGLMGKVD